MDNYKRQNYRVWYTAVILVLVLQIVFYYWFTCHYK